MCTVQETVEETLHKDNR